MRGDTVNFEFAGIIAYIGLQLGVGVYVSRKILSESDYFLSGRSLGIVLATASIAATWFGAEACLSSSGLVFANGLSGGRADPFGYAICLLVMGVLLATRLWKGQFLTLGDLFRRRFGIAVEKVAVVLMIPTSLLWAAAQIRAFGQVLAVSSGTESTVGMAIATGVVILYSTMGGLRADVMTDLVQGIGIVVGLGALGFATVSHYGGIDATLHNIDPQRLALIPGDESWLTQIDSWLIPILGSLVAQELVARVSASRTAAIARNAALLAAGVYLVVGMIPIFLALAGHSLVPVLEDHEQFLPTLARAQLTPLFYIIFAGAIVSAILSTVDSALLAVGSLAAHNLLGKQAAGWTEAGRVRLARSCVAAAGLVALVIAILSESIHSLVESASGFGSSGLLIITIFGLFSGFGRHRAALAALLAGLVVITTAQYIWVAEAPFLLSVISALTAYIIVGYWERKNSRLANPT